MATVEIVCSECGRTIVVQLAKPGGFTGGHCPKCGHPYTVDVEDNDNDD